MNMKMHTKGLHSKLVIAVTYGDGEFNGRAGLKATSTF